MLSRGICVSHLSGFRFVLNALMGTWGFFGIMDWWGSMFENFVLFAVFFNGYLLGKQATGYLGANSQFFLFFLF